MIRSLEELSTKRLRSRARTLAFELEAETRHLGAPTARTLAASRAIAAEQARRAALPEGAPA